MKGFENSTYLALFIISNVIALCLLVTALEAPKTARLLFSVLFAWAGYTNWNYAMQSPQVYLEYANLAFINLYKEFINGWFSKHIAACIGVIAVCQLLISISLLLKGVVFKIGIIGAIFFLLAIAPLGVGSAFPCTLIMATGLYVLLKRCEHDFIWKHRKPQTLTVDKNIAT